MKRHTAREWTVEEFDDWSGGDRPVRGGRARRRTRRAGRASRWCPRPSGTRSGRPTLLPPAGGGAAPGRRSTRRRRPSPPPPSTASRSRTAASASPAGAPSGSGCSSANLAETGSVHLASAAARLSARSAYRLRARSPAFAAAWDTADQLAVGRLSALAFDRAINGRTEQVWQRGRAGRGEAPAERPAADVAAGPARSPPLRRPVGAAQGRRRRSPGRGAGELPGAARRARGHRIGIAAMASANIGTIRAGARRAAEQRAGREAARTAGRRVAQRSPIDVTPQWWRGANLHLPQRHFRRLCAPAMGLYPCVMTYAKDATPPFYHGTRADLQRGRSARARLQLQLSASRSSPGSTSPARSTRRSGAASWPRATGRSGSTSSSRPARSRTIPTSPTRNSPAIRPNPTAPASRSRIVGEVAEWEGHPPERLKEMKDHLERLKAQGIEAID